MRYVRVKLKNGSTLGIINIPGVQTTTLAAFIKAGFKYDPHNKPGLAHFAEHMLFDGTKNYPTPLKLAWEIEKFGGWHDAFTWIEHQYQLIHLPKKNLEHGIKVFMDIMTNPLFSPEEFVREKKMIKEEILRNRADPEKAILDYAWQPLFFKGTPIDRPYSGTESDVNNLTLKDVRRFIDTNFSSESTIFLVATDVPENKLVEEFEKYSGKYTSPGRHSPLRLEVVGPDRLKVFPYEAEQTSIAFGIKTISFNHEDRHKLEVIRDLLGGYFGARLPQKLRDGGLIYNWNIWQDNLAETGYLIFKSSTESKNVYKFVEIVLREFERLREKPVSQEELDIVKGHIIGSLFCNTQTGFDYINWFGLQELMSEKILTLEDQANIYKKISAEEVLETAKKYFVPENIYLAILGDAKEERLAKLLRQ